MVIDDLPPPASDTLVGVPIIDMTGTYLGFEGGLYPGGLNTMSPAHLDAGLSFASQIEPLNSSGVPDAGGDAARFTERHQPPERSALDLEQREESLGLGVSREAGRSDYNLSLERDGDARACHRRAIRGIDLPQQGIGRSLPTPRRDREKKITRSRRHGPQHSENEEDTSFRWRRRSIGVPAKT